MFLVDTGSSNSLISEELWERFFKKTCPLKKATLQLAGAGGNGLDIKGVIMGAQITIRATNGKEVMMNQDLIVVKGLKTEVIAGMDFLQAGKGLVNTANLTLTLFENDFKMVSAEESSIFEIETTEERCEKEPRCDDWLWGEQRVGVILGQVDTGYPGMSEEIRSQVTKAVKEYADVFALDGEIRPGPDIKIKLSPIHNIPVTDQPIKVGFHQLEKVQEELNKLAALGVIRPSESLYNSRMFLLKKAGKPGEPINYRIIQDYRAVNHLLPDLPTQIDEPEVILSSFGKAKYFGVLDLKSSYHQLELAEDSRPLTAFSVNKDKWEFNKLPMGLKTSSSYLVSLVKSMLRSIQDKQARDRIKPYMDDLCLQGETETQFLDLLTLLFEKLREFKLYLKPSKCTILKLEVKFLGFIISENKCSVDKSRIDTLMKTKIPTTIKQVRSLLGAASYLRKHIPQFEERCAGLRTDLLSCKKVKGPITLSKNGVASFWKVLKGIEECCDLAFPKLDKRLHLYTDASETVIGGCLLYFNDEEDPRVLGFYSKKIPERLVHQHITIKELWGIVQSVERFEFFLKGKRFTLRSDSKVICSPNYMKKVSNAAHKRWLDTLYQYDFDLIHISSEDNCIADYMTRKDVGQAEIGSIPEASGGWTRDKDNLKEEDWSAKMVAMVTEVTGEQADKESKKNAGKPDAARATLIDEQRKDPAIAYMIRNVETGEEPDPRSPSAELRQYLSLWKGLSLDKDGLLWYSSYLNWDTIKTHVLCLPLSLQRETIAYAHSAAGGAHIGIDKLFHRMRERYFFPNLEDLCKYHVMSCLVCEKMHAEWTKDNKAPVESYVASWPSDRVAVDTAFIKRSARIDPNEYNYIILAVCCYSGYLISRPVKVLNKDTVLHEFLTAIIPVTSVMKCLVSDQGSEYNNKLFKEVAAVLGIRHEICAARRPQSNRAEQSVKMLKAAIKKTVATRPKDWVLVLGLLTLNINSTVQSYSHVSAYSMFFGRRPNIPLDCLHGTSMTEFYQQGRNAEVEFFHNVTNLARILHAEKLITTEYSRTYANKNALFIDLGPGQQVLLKRPPPNKVEYRGLQFKWAGPYTVSDRVGRSLYVLTDGEKSITAHQDQMKLLRQEPRKTEPALPLTSGMLPRYNPGPKKRNGGTKDKEDADREKKKVASHCTGAKLDRYFEPQSLHAKDPDTRKRQITKRIEIDPYKKSYD